MRRIWCWFVGHRWRIRRIVRDCNLALAHLHPYAGCDADCPRCGAQWRDFELHCAHRADVHERESG